MDNNSPEVTDNEAWQIFICYRRDDGLETARWIYNLLNDLKLGCKAPDTQKPVQLKVYFDQTAPVGENWKKFHLPSLQTARAIIVICSPGSYSRLDTEDHVYAELDWWVEHRATGPLVIETVSEDGRWVPKIIRDRWKDIQRLYFNPTEYNALSADQQAEFSKDFADRILSGIRLSIQGVQFEELERQRQISEKLRREKNKFLVAAFFFLVVAFIASGLYGVANQRQREIDIANDSLRTQVTKLNRITYSSFFYEDRFAISYKYNRYGYIDHEGDPVFLDSSPSADSHPFIEAGIFDNQIGLAKVRFKDNDRYHYIDTSFMPYLLAQSWKQPDASEAVEIKEGIDSRSLDLSLFPKLSILLLSGNGLSEVPREIFRISNLSALRIKDNSLVQIPVAIANLKSLQKLDLANNQLTELPKEISRLGHLERLTLSSNRLVTLPEEFGRLTGLSWLDLSFNALRGLPSGMGKLKYLKRLYLTENQLIAIPAELYNLKNLQELDLSKNEIRELPPGIGALNSLQVLNLTVNSLKAIPPDIGDLKNLKSLYLAFNKLQNVPREIGSLPNLQELNLSRNGLTVLPGQIGDLQALQGLSLSHNQLSELPSSIGQLKKLRWIGLDSNSLTSLPDDLSALQNLEVLNLSNNKLNDLPESIFKLKHLQKLDIRNNPFSKERIKKIKARLSKTVIIF